MFRKSVVAIVLCMAVLLSAFAPAVYADTIIEIDTGGLWGNDILEDDEGGSDDSETGDNTGDNNDDNTGDDNITYIPEDNVDNSNKDDNKEIQVVPPKEDEEKDDNKTTVLPTTKPGNTTETPKEEVKKEEPKVEMVSFADVKETDWFYTDVGTLAGMGVINGYPDGSFKPEANVTRAEFLKLLVTLVAGDNLFVSYDKIFEDVSVDEWYSKYITTAFVFGIIDVEDYGANFNPDQPITRREVAKLVSNAVIMEVGGYKTPFADTADHNIIALYRYAIMQGTVDPTTGHRYFYPDTQITRAETAAVILRLHKSAEGGNDYVEQFMKDNNMPPLQALSVNLPTTKNDFYNVLTNAWDNNQAFVNYEYPFDAGGEEMQRLKDSIYSGYRLAALSHPEYATYVTLNVKTSFDGTKSTLTLEFDSDNDGYTYDRLMSEKEKAEKCAGKIAEKLFDGNETELERADRIYDYVIDTLEYDNSLEPSSYTAYGALSTEKAVCQGYSAVFNMLCRSAGVLSLAVSNDEHMWNVVYADGGFYHYDTTYDDTESGDSDYKGTGHSEFLKDKLHFGYEMPEAGDFI